MVWEVTVKTTVGDLGVCINYVTQGEGPRCVHTRSDPGVCKATPVCAQTT